MTNQYELKVVRDDTILTTSYVAGTVIDNAENYNQLMLALKYTKGSLTSFEIKIEYSFDGVTFHQQTFTSISTGTSTGVAGEHTFAPAGNVNFELEIPVKWHQVKISAKGTGTVTNSSLKIDAVLGII